MRKCLLQAISPLLTVFQSYISLVCQNAVLHGDGLRAIKELDPKDYKYCSAIYQQSYLKINLLVYSELKMLLSQTGF